MTATATPTAPLALPAPLTRTEYDALYEVHNDRRMVLLDDLRGAKKRKDAEEVTRLRYELDIVYSHMDALTQMEDERTDAVDVLAAPEFYAQPQQRHMSGVVTQNARLLAPLYAIGGEEGFYLPAAAGLCLTREAAREAADEDNEDRARTGVNPVLVLAIRTQTRLLERGVSPEVVALICDELMTDVEGFLANNRMDESVSCVHIADLEDGEWVPQSFPASEWADKPLWSPAAQDARA